jgi:hypothetical protein
LKRKRRHSRESGELLHFEAKTPSSRAQRRGTSISLQSGNKPRFLY